MLVVTSLQERKTLGHGGGLEHEAQFSRHRQVRSCSEPCLGPKASPTGCYGACSVAGDVWGTSGPYTVTWESGLRQQMTNGAQALTAWPAQYCFLGTLPNLPLEFPSLVLFLGLRWDRPPPLPHCFWVGT